MNISFLENSENDPVVFGTILPLLRIYQCDFTACDSMVTYLYFSADGCSHYKVLIMPLTSMGYNDLL